MNIYLFLIALFITPQILFSNNENSDKSHLPPQSHPQKPVDLTDFIKNNSQEDSLKEYPITKNDLIAFRNQLAASSSKSAEKLNNELARSKKMACQTGIGLGFVFLTKFMSNIANTHPHLNNFFISSGSIFCLISLWETLKAGYNAAYYLYKRESQKVLATSLNKDLENFNDEAQNPQGMQ